MFIAIKSKEDCSKALEAARRHSPNIEIVDETTLVFDLTGSKAREAPKIVRELRKKFEAVAVSDNLAAALLLARYAREFKVQEEQFKVQSSKFKVRKAGGETLNSDGLRAQAPDAGGDACAPVVTAREPQEANAAEQTLNPEPETLNPPAEEFKVQSSKFKVRNAEVEAKESGSSEQTLNVEPETLNFPKAPDAADATFASRDACAPVQDRFQVPSSKFHALRTGSETEKSSSSKQTLNVEPETLNSPKAAEPLARLPIDAISDKVEFLDLMDSWAIHDLGSFSQLPEDEMVARFGLEIIELRKQAKGEAFRASNWNVHEDKFFWEKELEGAIETIEPLNFVLSKGVALVFQNLDHVGLSTQSAKITLRGREKKKVYRIRIVFPTKNQKLWIRQIVTRIELDTPEFNIEHVRVEFRSAKPRTVQNNLYSGAILEPENLNLIVSKLKKVVGLEKIGVPRLRDAWRRRFYMTEDLSPLIAERSSGFRVQGSEKEEVSSSKFQVPGLSEQTLNSEPGTRNPPSANEFKVQGSKFKVPEEDRPRNTRNKESGVRSQESGSGKQTTNSKPKTQNSTLNLELGTLNPPPADAADATFASKDACAPVVMAREPQEANAAEQTQNPKPKTQNSTLNLELGTLNPPPADAADATFASKDACAPVVMAPVESAGEREDGTSSKQTQNPKPKTQNYPKESSVISHQSSVVSSVFYYLPQPLKARVFFESGEPKALIIEGKRELVRTSGGPWRMDAEWHEEKGWRRDEWDIETESGAVYRVFVDKNGEAFVDGGYD